MTAALARRKAAAAWQCFDFCRDRNPERAAAHRNEYLRWLKVARGLGA